MAQKIRSIELHSGVVVTFNGPIITIEEDGFTISITTTDLESIRDTAKSNAKAEAGNGTIQPNKEKVQITLNP